MLHDVNTSPNAKRCNQQTNTWQLHANAKQFEQLIKQLLAITRERKTKEGNHKKNTPGNYTRTQNIAENVFKPTR